MNPLDPRPGERPGHRKYVQTCGEREFLWLLGIFACSSLLVAVLAALH